MNIDKRIERIVDWKNSQCYVKYMDGSYGFRLSTLVPFEIKQAYLDDGGHVR